MWKLARELEGVVGVMLPREFGVARSEGRLRIYRWGSWDDVEELGARLFAGLRELDARGAEVIVAPLPEPGGMRTAVRDRLQKAAMS
jgi:L-threonylcarbamoyladenylate synthase